MERKTRILVVDDDEGIRWALTGLFEAKGYAVRAAASVADAAKELEREAPDVAFIDLQLGDGSGIDVVRRLRAAAPGAAGIVVTGQATVRNAVHAIKEGAFDFVEKPVSAERILPVLDRAEEHARRRRDPHAGLRGELLELGQTPLLGRSAAMAAVLEQIGQVARTRGTSALILGESGTGKELVARAIHHGSARRAGRFVAVNCAALSEGLLESELFGYEKGAFTGAASSGKMGLFEAANKGTIFLDEIGEMALPTQSKLLRVLQERAVKRVGAIEDVPIDVRVVASTNRDLAREVKENRFRLDLYYRLNVVTIRMPPLRERADDIPLLAEYFLAGFAREMEKELAGFAPAALAALAAHPFPGNVRELRNVVEHAAVVAAGPLVGREHLALEESVGAGAAAGPAVAPGGAPALAAPSPVPGAGPGGVAVGSGGGAGGSAAIGAGAGTAAGGAGAGAAAGAITLALPDARLETAERELIAVVLRMVGGNRRKAAEKLGINRSTLYAKLKLYGLGGGEPGESRDGEGAEGEG